MKARESALFPLIMVSRPFNVLTVTQLHGSGSSARERGWGARDWRE